MDGDGSMAMDDERSASRPESANQKLRQSTGAVPRAGSASALRKSQNQEAANQDKIDKARILELNVSVYRNLTKS